MTDSPTTRILDAAMNRTHEGLRVIEDFVRFVLDDAHLTGLLKRLRHDLAEVGAALPFEERHAARETQLDVGTQISTEQESARVDAWDVCQASCERVKQSLRSLEEYSKVSSPELAARLEALRYQFYTLERLLSATQTNRIQLDGIKLCVLIDGRNSDEEFIALAQQLIGAGVPMIQLRDKRLCDAELIERARVLVGLAHDTESPSAPLVIVNDRADIAAAVNADGVHLGQDDLDVKDARTILGPRRLIGVSTHNIEQARAAVLNGANYLGAGPTFPSTTKDFAEWPGLDFLQHVAQDISLPTFAIGGICPENLAEVLATGISRIAVSGAVVLAANAGASSGMLLEILSRDAP